MNTTTPVKKSRIPTWVTVVGILAILFGALGVLRGAQQMVMPQMLEMQKEFIANMTEFVAEKSRNTGNSKTPRGEPIDHEKIFGAFEELMIFPDWMKTWSPLIGAVSMLVAGLYLFSGVLLLMTKPVAIKLFYAALGLSVLWAIIMGVIFGMSGNTMLMAQLPGNVISIIIDIVLLSVVLSANKDVFVKKTPSAFIGA